MDEVAYGEMGECDVCGEWKEEAAAVAAAVAAAAIASGNGWQRMNKVDKEGAKAGDGAGEEEGASVEAWDMLGGSVCGVCGRERRQ